MYNNPYFTQQPRYSQPMVNQPMPSVTQPQYLPPIQNPNGLNGKYVDSIDVVKASETLLDGSITYFPFTDGSTIVTKQLQTDGTTKTSIYKLVQEEEKDQPKYVTIEDVKKEIEKIDLSELDDIKDELKEIKKQLKNKKSKDE